MNQNKKTLAIITARGGSKRIPRKNLIEVGGISLVGRSIIEALNSGVFTEIILSSDDDEILKVANSFSGVRGLKRAENLSTDSATSIDVVEDIISFESADYDYICLLQPTSPLRKAVHIQESYAHLLSNDYDTLVSVKPVVTNPFHIVTKNGDLVSPLLGNELFKFRTQEAPELYCLNGCIYFAKESFFKQYKTFLSKKTGVYLMSEYDSLDIDTPEDLQLAKKILEN